MNNVANLSHPFGFNAHDGNQSTTMSRKIAQFNIENTVPATIPGVQTRTNTNSPDVFEERKIPQHMQAFHDYIASDNTNENLDQIYSAILSSQAAILSSRDKKNAQDDKIKQAIRTIACRKLTELKLDSEDSFANANDRTSEIASRIANEILAKDKNERDPIKVEVTGALLAMIYPTKVDEKSIKPKKQTKDIRNQELISLITSIIEPVMNPSTKDLRKKINNSLLSLRLEDSHILAITNDKKNLINSVVMALGNNTNKENVKKTVSKLTSSLDEIYAASIESISGAVSSRKVILNELTRFRNNFSELEREYDSSGPGIQEQINSYNNKITELSRSLQALTFTINRAKTITDILRKTTIYLTNKANNYYNGDDEAKYDILAVLVPKVAGDQKTFIETNIKEILYQMIALNKAKKFRMPEDELKVINQSYIFDHETEAKLESDLDSVVELFFDSKNGSELSIIEQDFNEIKNRGGSNDFREPREPFSKEKKDALTQLNSYFDPGAKHIDLGNVDCNSQDSLSRLRKISQSDQNSELAFGQRFIESQITRKIANKFKDKISGKTTEEKKIYVKIFLDYTTVMQGQEAFKSKREFRYTTSINSNGTGIISMGHNKQKGAQKGLESVHSDSKYPIIETKEDYQRSKSRAVIEKNRDSRLSITDEGIEKRLDLKQSLYIDNRTPNDPKLIYSENSLEIIEDIIPICDLSGNEKLDFGCYTIKNSSGVAEDDDETIFNIGTVTELLELIYDSNIKLEKENGRDLILFPEVQSDQIKSMIHKILAEETCKIHVVGDAKSVIELDFLAHEVRNQISESADYSTIKLAKSENNPVEEIITNMNNVIRQDIKNNPLSDNSFFGNFPPFLGSIENESSKSISAIDMLNKHLAVVRRTLVLVDRSPMCFDNNKFNRDKIIELLSPTLQSIDNYTKDLDEKAINTMQYKLFIRNMLSIICDADQDVAARYSYNRDEAIRLVIDYVKKEGLDNILTEDLVAENIDFLYNAKRERAQLELDTKDQSKLDHIERLGNETQSLTQQVNHTFSDPIKQQPLASINSNISEDDNGSIVTGNITSYS